MYALKVIRSYPLAVISLWRYFSSVVHLSLRKKSSSSKSEAVAVQPDIEQHRINKNLVDTYNYKIGLLFGIFDQLVFLFSPSLI